MLMPGSQECQPNTLVKVSTRITSGCCARRVDKRMPGASSRAFGRFRGLLELGSIVVTITIAVVLHVVHGAAIAFLEAIAELTAVMFVDRRVFVHLVIVCIGPAMVHIVATCRFNTFTEALALRVTITIRRAIPIAITIAVLVLILRLRSAVLRRVRWWWRFLGGGLDGCGRSHAEGKCGN